MEKKTTMQSNPSSKSSMRCPHCAGPLSNEMETSEWTVPPLIRDSFSMIGTAVGGTTSAFYGFNHVMPVVRRWIKGPMWLHFLVGVLSFLAHHYLGKDCYPLGLIIFMLSVCGLEAPPVIVFSSACAGLAGGAVPALAQLASSSYHAAISSSALQPSSSQDEKINKSRPSSTLKH